MIAGKAKSLQNVLRGKLDILAAFYGDKLEIEEMIADIDHRIHDIARDDKIQSARPFVDVPKYVLDVTIPVRFALENLASFTGLRLEGGKASIVGFFNPIPECLNREPVLCIVHKVEGRNITV